MAESTEAGTWYSLIRHGLLNIFLLDSILVNIFFFGQQTRICRKKKLLKLIAIFFCINRFVTVIDVRGQNKIWIIRGYHNRCDHFYPSLSLIPFNAIKKNHLLPFILDNKANDLVVKTFHWTFLHFPEEKHNKSYDKIRKCIHSINFDGVLQKKERTLK